MNIEIIKPTFTYGTSGFRANAKYMGDVVFWTAYYTGVYAR